MLYSKRIASTWYEILLHIARKGRHEAEVKVAI